MGQASSPGRGEGSVSVSPVIAAIQRLDDLTVQLVAIGNCEPHLSGSERVSLLHDDRDYDVIARHSKLKIQRVDTV